ncbi:unnamed protein product [Acanthoscelides obtectus]|uniref:HTH CENPB-type domain-containing protein n=1 Tax=Acanthoscelides obtectus TaxID=200917 RepID=A0A9P0KFV5_ACAOB|nr:unnamed protein product [Acanthoscelides obtectus]CAK1654734.1 hypothetical protein AOBTE_LOCUS18802 [Acanthoscelides obtectus]
MAEGATVSRKEKDGNSQVAASPTIVKEYNVDKTDMLESTMSSNLERKRPLTDAELSELVENDDLDDFLPLDNNIGTDIEPASDEEEVQDNLQLGAEEQIRLFAVTLTITIVCAQPGPSGIQKKIVTPFDISPVPTLKKKTTNRGRKASQAAVITSSPYKDELLLSIANKTKQEIKSVKKKVFSQSTKNTSSITSNENEKQRSLGESESDDDETELVLADDDLDMDDMPGQKEPDDLDVECIFCESRFSEDRKGELWVQCLMCNMWCHVDCAGADKDDYCYSCTGASRDLLALDFLIWQEAGSWSPIKLETKQLQLFGAGGKPSGDKSNYMEQIMVNKYIRKSNRGSWTEETMQMAMNEAKTTSISSASKKYGIPIGTLHRHIKKGDSSKNLGRFKPVFSKELEREICDLAMERDILFYGLTKRSLQQLAYEVAKVNNIPHPFACEKAGKAWLDGFMKRHPQLAYRTPEPTALARCSALNRTQVNRFYNNLWSIISHHNFLTRPDDIYNMDETGVKTSASKPPRVIPVKDLDFAPATVYENAAVIEEQSNTAVIDEGDKNKDPVVAENIGLNNNNVTEIENPCDVINDPVDKNNTDEPSAGNDSEDKQKEEKELNSDDKKNEMR